MKERTGIGKYLYTFVVASTTNVAALVFPKKPGRCVSDRTASTARSQLLKKKVGSITAVAKIFQIVTQKIFNVQ